MRSQDRAMDALLVNRAVKTQENPKTRPMLGMLIFPQIWGLVLCLLFT